MPVIPGKLARVPRTIEAIHAEKSSKIAIFGPRPGGFDTEARAMFLANIHRVFPTEVNCLIIAFKIAYISRIVSRETF